METRDEKLNRNLKRSYWFVAAVCVIAFAIGDWNKRTEAVKEAELNKLETQRAVSEHHVRVGMTREQILTAWGKPARVNRTVTANKILEQWVYERGERNAYLYVDNDVLRSFQDER